MTHLQSGGNDGNPGPQPSPRLDRFAFDASAVASFLESQAATYVENLEALFDGDRATLHWLHEVWLPEEAQHGRLLKDHVEQTWPDFDWQGAYAQFSLRYVPQCDYQKLGPSPGLEALARCVTETQATMIYRCIGNYALDPELTALMQRISADEVRHFKP